MSSFRLDDEIHVRMILDLEKVLPTVKFVSLILISVYLLHLNNFQIEIYTFQQCRTYASTIVKKFLVEKGRFIFYIVKNSIVLWSKGKEGRARLPGSTYVSRLLAFPGQFA